MMRKRGEFAFGVIARVRIGVSVGVGREGGREGMENGARKE